MYDIVQLILDLEKNTNFQALVVLMICSIVHLRAYSPNKQHKREDCIIEIRSSKMINIILSYTGMEKTSAGEKWVPVLYRIVHCQLKLTM